MSFEVGCLNYLSKEKRFEAMQKRFLELKIPFKFFSHFSYLEKHQKFLDSENDQHSKRVFSCMLNHLYILHHYYENTNFQYFIVCEDDIFLNINFAKQIPYIEIQMKEFDLDIVLLGCLLPRKHPLPGLFSYGNDLWGTQCYMISRTYTKQLLDQFFFTDVYLMIKNLKERNLPFSADWIITKQSLKRAYIYPMLCVEEGNSGDNNDVHQRFHNQCTQLHYHPSKYI